MVRKIPNNNRHQLMAAYALPDFFKSALELQLQGTFCFALLCLPRFTFPEPSGPVRRST